MSEEKLNLIGKKCTVTKYNETFDAIIVAGPVMQPETTDWYFMVMIGNGFRSIDAYQVTIDDAEI